MDPINLKDIADLSMNGILLFMIIKLWDRFNTLTDKLFVYLENAQNDREVQKAEIVAKVEEKK